jgi:serine/threonine protein kinase
LLEHLSQIPTVIDLNDESTVILSETLPARASDLWLIGARIEQRYKITDIRGGSGISGMGVVYIVEDGETVYAVKTFQRRFARNLGFIERFIREAETWILTGFHPNIVHAHFLDIIDAVPFLFLECVPRDEAGRISLADWIQEGPLPLDMALRFAIQVCDGMTHATLAVPGLVHRDLKPENLLIGPGGIVKITDFGLVRCRATGEIMMKRHLDETAEVPQEAGITRAGTVFGTPSYMAPEQFSDPGEVTSAADVYAFGCCLYEMLAGRPPFVSTTRTTSKRLHEFRLLHEEVAARPIETLAANCPPELAEIVRRCMAKVPSQRWSCFSAVRNELARVYEQVLGQRPADLAQPDLEPRAVAQQMRSLNVLEGYQRAVRLRNLRDNQERSPYAFHLALASYFHCAQDRAEERRQLQKAVRVRGVESGDEVTRRLGEILVREGRLNEAEQLFTTFLEESPEGVDGILVPYFHMLLLGNQYAAAERLLNEVGDEDIRTHYLWASLRREEGRIEEAGPLLRHLLDLLLDRVLGKLLRIEADDRPGWDGPGDPERLAEVLRALRPGCDLGPLERAVHSYWPDLTGYPDLSPDLAWLSQVLGELAPLWTTLDTDAAALYGRLAEVLGYPSRLELYREREEYWYWMQPHDSIEPAP